MDELPGGGALEELAGVVTSVAHDRFLNDCVTCGILHFFCDYRDQKTKIAHKGLAIHSGPYEIPKTLREPCGATHLREIVDCFSILIGNIGP